MTRIIEFIATGMVTFTPHSVPYPNKLGELTFVMVANPSKRDSHNDKSKKIVRHDAFLLAPSKNIASGASFRPPDLPPNRFGYGGWILDRERLMLEKDPGSGVTFDSTISYIADMTVLNHDGIMDPAYATLNPPSLVPVGAQFVLKSGTVRGGGRSTKVQFKVPGTADVPPIEIGNEVHILLTTEEQAFTINAQSLSSGDSLDPLRLQFENNQQYMAIYFGSAPLAALGEVPSGEQDVAHSQDVDFELYYDLRKGGPPAKQPIPNHKPGGPVPGSERCPPLQNGP